MFTELHKKLQQVLAVFLGTDDIQIYASIGISFGHNKSNKIYAFCHHNEEMIFLQIITHIVWAYRKVAEVHVGNGDNLCIYYKSIGNYTI